MCSFCYYFVAKEYRILPLRVKSLLFLISRQGITVAEYLYKYTNGCVGNTAIASAILKPCFELMSPFRDRTVIGISQL